MSKNVRGVVQFVLTLVISQSISKSQCCMDGSNQNLGVVVEPYTRSSDDVEHSELVVTNTVNILSRIFPRISLDANTNSIDSTILLEIAKANSKNSNVRNITVTAALQYSDLRSFTESLDNVLEKISDSNRIFPGSINGLTVTSIYYEALNNFRYEDIYNIINIPGNFVTNLKAVTNSFGEIQAISTIVNLVKSHPQRVDLPIGIRSGHCDHLERVFSMSYAVVRIFPKIREGQERIGDILDKLDFLTCRELPSADQTPSESAESLKVKVKGILAFIKKRWPALKVIVETGWPTVGQSINGILGSVASMNKFWCEIDGWSNENSIEVNFYSAFEEHSTDGSGVDAVAVKGEWTRILNVLSGFPNLVGKIEFPADSSSEGSSYFQITNFVMISCVVLCIDLFVLD